MNSRCLPTTICSAVSRSFMGSAIQSASDFARLSREATEKADRIRNFLKNTQTLKRPRDTLIALDAISNEICSVMDAAEVARNCHFDENFIQMADESYQMLFEYLSRVNTGALYDTYTFR